MRVDDEVVEEVKRDFCSMAYPRRVIRELKARLETDDDVQLAFIDFIIARDDLFAAKKRLKEAKKEELLESQT